MWGYSFHQWHYHQAYQKIRAPFNCKYLKYQLKNFTKPPPCELCYLAFRGDKEIQTLLFIFVYLWCYMLCETTPLNLTDILVHRHHFLSLKLLGNHGRREKLPELVPVSWSSPFYHLIGPGSFKLPFVNYICLDGCLWLHHPAHK